MTIQLLVPYSIYAKDAVIGLTPELEASLITQGIAKVTDSNPSNQAIPYYAVEPAAAAAAAAIPATRKPVMRQIGTECYLPNTSNVSITWGQQRSPHYARGQIVNPTVVYANWYMNGATEANGLGAGTIKAVLEYPAGVYNLSNENLANGGGAVSFPIGSKFLTFNVTIPDGAQFWMRVLVNVPSGVCWHGYAGGNQNNANVAPAGGGGNLSSSPLSDLTMGGNIQFTGGSGIYPIAILGLTAKPSVFIVGDSRESGGAGFANLYGDLGLTAVAVGTNFGYLNGALSATLLVNWNAGTHGYLYQLISAGYFTHVSNGYGINDIGAGTAALTIATARATFATNIKAQNSSIKIIGHTLYPYVGSSDVFVTKANQTIGSNQTRLFTFNSYVRSGIAGEDFVCDTADAMDPFREGKYPVSLDPSLASRTPASVTGSISGTTLTVTAIGAGSLSPGDTLYDAGGNIKDSAIIVEQLTGATGSTGTYRINNTYSGFPYPNAVTSTTITTAGMVTRDGLHAQGYGETLIQRAIQPRLLAILAAA